MADSTLLAIKLLLADSLITTLLGGPNIFGKAIPEKFDPTVQPCVTVSTEGGNPHPEVPIAKARVKVVVWAGINQGILARQVDDLVSRRLHRQNGIDLTPDGFIIISQQTVLGQDGTDPDEGYATVLSFYEITSRDSEPNDALLIQIAAAGGLLRLPVYADNEAAGLAGLGPDALYRTGGDPDIVCVVHAV